jgi:hypothetical protein
MEISSSALDLFIQSIQGESQMTLIKKNSRLFLQAGLYMLTLSVSATHAADNLSPSAPRTRIDSLREADGKVHAGDDNYANKGQVPPQSLPLDQYPDVYNNYIQPIATAIDYHNGMVYLFNYENDKLIILDPTSLPGWPGNVPLQHTVVMPEGKKIYITSDNTPDHPSYIIALGVNEINFPSQGLNHRL